MKFVSKRKRKDFFILEYISGIYSNNEEQMKGVMTMCSNQSSYVTIIVCYLLGIMVKNYSADYQNTCLLTPMPERMPERLILF